MHTRVLYLSGTTILMVEFPSNVRASCDVNIAGADACSSLEVFYSCIVDTGRHKIKIGKANDIAAEMRVNQPNHMA